MSLDNLSCDLAQYKSKLDYKAYCNSLLHEEISSETFSITASLIWFYKVLVKIVFADDPLEVTAAQKSYSDVTV